MKITNGLFDQNGDIADKRLDSLKATLPPVTIIVTNYNYENYIVSCLKSVAGQTYPNYRCVIIDDASTDESVKKIKHFIETSEAGRKFSIVVHEKNGGQMEAFKTGLKYADSVFVVMLDADDLLLEDFLSAHVKIHLSYRPAAFTSCNQYQINEHGQILAGTHPDLKSNCRLRYITPRSIINPFWIWATTSSMMFRKAALELIIPHNTQPFKICADNYICHFANLLGGSILIPSVHGCYRRHNKNYFSSNPFVGGELPTGDMKSHPRHEIVRSSILNHLLDEHEKFFPILAEMNFLTTVLRSARPWEILTMSRKCKKKLKKSRYYLLKISLFSIILHNIKNAQHYFMFLKKRFREKHVWS